MQVNISQESFSKALNFVTKAVSVKPSIPILANVMIEAKENMLTMSATNLEMGINVKQTVDTKASGSVTVPARTLAEFVGSLSVDKLSIELKEKKLLISNKHNSAEFNVMPSDDFPPLPKPKGDPIFIVDADDFSKSIKQVGFAAATDDSRPVLTGLLFECTKRKLSMVGVDGFRLSKKTIDISKSTLEQESFIVPAKSLQELETIISSLYEEKDVVRVFLLKEKNQMIFEFKDIEVSTRLIEGEFPNYQQILPTKHTFAFSVDKETLAKTVKIVNIFARSAVGNKAVFALDSEKSKLMLSAVVAEVGGNQSTVEIYETEGSKLKTAFNTKFLADMVNSIAGTDISFESNGPTAPGSFKDKKDDSYVHIIMPMRID